MRIITRRQLNHFSGRILDEVLASGEPVEVVTRGKGSIVISRKAESVYDRWIREGLVIPATEDIASVAPIDGVTISVEDLRAAIDDAD